MGNPRREFRESLNLFECGAIFNFLERDITLLEIAKLNIKGYKLEIYGRGWDKFEELKPFYKGVVEYGEAISKIYNSAEYTIVLGRYVLQQRTFEAAASGCQPIVIDPRKNSEDVTNLCFEESLIFIEKIDEIPLILGKEIKKDLNCFRKHYSYQSFIKKMIDVVNELIM